MYRATTSFTTKDYNVKQKQILEDDFTTQDEIDEFLEIGYIEVYDGSIEITENGEYDVSDYETAEVNVSGGSSFVIENCEQLFFNNRRIDNVKDLLPYCVPTTSEGMFYQSSNLTEVPFFDTSSSTNCNNMFDGCSNIITIPPLDFSSNQYAIGMFSNCSKLVNLPELDFSQIGGSNMNSTFSGCPMLSDESLNNIMASVIKSNVTNVSRKKLSYIGLSSEQATRCQSLSNYQAFLNAGWTTGY